MKTYDVIVVGAGHAGMEAAHVAAQLGCLVLFLTLRKDTIGKLSCNPAVGGVAKSHLVRETDILGGLIGRFTDKTACQYRILNKSKGKAVWATRAQVDRELYTKCAQDYFLHHQSIKLEEVEVESLIVKKNIIQGVLTNKGSFKAKKVIICPGTFLDGLIHIGFKHFPAGRLYEPASFKLASVLCKLGFRLKHFKTGTCACLDKNSIQFSKMKRQPPDKQASPFSFFTNFVPFNKMSCFITYTNPKTHRIIEKNLKYSPLYQGIIKAKGVRYCPSLEDKVVKFCDKQRHQIFIEPEGRNSQTIYPNGISTSLPEDVQYEFIHSIEGLEKAKIIKPGYGIEHAVIEAKDLAHSLESKKIKGLYFAGQINGTTGYEEASSQGLLAGINAALAVKKKKPLVLKREESFIGLLVDDLVTKGTDEPYRMFTSRSEFRLLLREDNAIYRLGKISFDLGLLKRKDFLKIQDACARIKNEIKRLKSVNIKPCRRVDKIFKKSGESRLSQATSAYKVLKRPKILYKDMARLGFRLGLDRQDEINQVEIEVKYEGFIKRELTEVEKLRNLSKVKIPKNFNYSRLQGLSKEIQEKLFLHRPATLRDALDISGITPAAILIILSCLKNR